MPGPRTYSPIVELRQYTLYPGKRDVLIDLFDREFVESQEAVGIKVIGQFRDLDDPNLFTWLRGFDDMAARAQALAGFYGGPVWEAHRDAANATMVDFSNVLLLRRVHEMSGFSLTGEDRPPPGETEVPQGLVVATIYHLDAPAGGGFSEFFERLLQPALTGTGALVLASFVTEDSPNNFPGLPVRESENVFVLFTLFSDPAAQALHVASLARSRLWREEITEALARHLKRAPETRKLSPTTRSLLHG